MFVKVLSIHRSFNFDGLYFNRGVSEHISARVVNRQGIVSVVRLNDCFVNTGDEINIVKSKYDESFCVKNNYTQDLIIAKFSQKSR